MEFCTNDDEVKLLARTGCGGIGTDMALDETLCAFELDNSEAGFVSSCAKALWLTFKAGSLFADWRGGMVWPRKCTALLLLSFFAA